MLAPLPARQTVVIVDTSNEIAGDGDIPHLQAIGQSRRMMVPNKEGQHRCSIVGVLGSAL